MSADWVASDEHLRGLCEHVFAGPVGEAARAVFDVCRTHFGVYDPNELDPAVRAAVWPRLASAFDRLSDAGLVERIDAVDVTWDPGKKRSRGSYRYRLTPKGQSLGVFYARMCPAGGRPPSTQGKLFGEAA